MFIFKTIVVCALSLLIISCNPKVQKTKAGTETNQMEEAPAVEQEEESSTMDNSMDDIMSDTPDLDSDDSMLDTEDAFSDSTDM